MSVELLVTQDAGVLDLRLNRPQAGNQLTAAMCERIVAALQALDGGIRVVRLTGTGADFCSGRESPMPPPGTVLDAESLRQRVAVPALVLYDALKAVPVPTLAVVQGRAHGVGTALAAACDITVAAEDAEFRVPEMDRDIPPTLVMSALADRVPIKTLAYLVLSRRSLSGAEACAAGLVARAVPTARLAAESEDLAAALAQNSPSTVRAVKQFLRDGVRLPPVPASVLAGHVLATAIAARYLPKREAP